MAMFQSIDTAGSGLQTYHTWLDVIANNIANVNDTASTNAGVFHQHFVVAREIAGNSEVGRGVRAAEVTQSQQTADLVYDPGNPNANADGNVYRADVDLSEQMGDIILAQRAFQANANVVDRAKEIYEAAIGIGRGI